MGALNWLEQAFTSMIVKLESTAFPKRGTLRFEGTGVEVEDDADAEETVVTITAGEGGGVPSSRTITAGNGLTGGGTLAADRTLSANFASSAAAVGSSSAGVAVTVSRGDHVHAHGDLAGGSFHAAADGSNAGFMSAALYTIANNFVTQAKSSNFTVSAARVQHFIVDVNSGDVTATLPTSSRSTGDVIVFDIVNASTNKLICSASDTSLPTEYGTSATTTLNVTSSNAGNGGRFALRWDGSKWVVIDHPRMRNNVAAYAGFGVNSGYWISPVHRWDPKDGQYERERVEKIDPVTTTNATTTTVLSRTHSTASTMVEAKMVARGVNTASGEAISLRVSAMFRKGPSGDLAQIGTTSDEGKTPSGSSLTWAATIALGATNVIDFKVTGESGKTIKWFCTCETVEDNFA